MVSDDTGELLRVALWKGSAPLLQKLHRVRAVALLVAVCLASMERGVQARQLILWLDTHEAKAVESVEKGEHHAQRPPQHREDDHDGRRKHLAVASRHKEA